MTHIHPKALRRRAAYATPPGGDGNEPFFRQVMFVLTVCIVAAAVAAWAQGCGV